MSTKLNDFDRYLGPYGKGILLREASHGNLQAYIDSNPEIDNSLRCRWSVQAVEAVAFVHSKGVMHSDLRPENYLVHLTKEMSLDLWLCDFGGSSCDELGSNVVHLPDDPFFDPRLPWDDSTPAIDIFSLGSIIYTITTGHWPYRQSPMVEEDKEAYNTKVIQMFTEGAFPDVSALRGGKVIEGCWNHQFKTAEEVLCAIKLEMATLDKQDPQSGRIRRNALDLNPV